MLKGYFVQLAIQRVEQRQKMLIYLRVDCRQWSKRKQNLTHKTSVTGKHERSFFATLLLLYWCASTGKAAEEL